MRQLVVSHSILARAFYFRRQHEGDVSKTAIVPPGPMTVRKTNGEVRSLIRKKLESETGRDELKALAKQYYKTTHDAIRRHDKHHLILGDRYEANAHIAMPLVEAAKPYIDVLRFQDFRDPIQHLDYWFKETGIPVLLADAAGIQREENNFTRNDGEWYTKVLDGLIENPGCIGFHLCGAYQRNKARRRDLLDGFEKPDEENEPHPGRQ